MSFSKNFSYTRKKNGFGIGFECNADFTESDDVAFEWSFSYTRSMNILLLFTVQIQIYLLCTSKGFLRD